MRPLIATLVMLFACSSQAPAVRDDERARAAALIAELKRELLAAVTQAMKAGGPAAIEACHAMAPAITERVAASGATIGRATRRPRNPTNLASGWQLDAIAQFERLGHQGTVAPFERVLPSGRVAYAEPLVVGEVCLRCHGEPAPDVTAVLRVRYPDDRATGYSLGELRGVAWVELPR